jgi:SAM-dependent methyltransferase
MTPGSQQIFKTRSVFDERSAQWESNYAPGGRMSSRVGRFVEELRSLVPAPACILDFGCGTGQIAQALAAEGWKVLGCDISRGMLERAPRSGSANWVQVDAQTAPALPFADASFDAVIASSVYEYVAAPADSFRELARILRPGGWILFSVPDLRHPVIWKEALQRLVVSLWPFGWLVARTRWRMSADSLRLSINRRSLAWWQAILAGTGFAARPPGRCQNPLALIVAQKKT